MFKPLLLGGLVVGFAGATLVGKTLQPAMRPWPPLPRVFSIHLGFVFGFHSILGADAISREVTYAVFDESPPPEDALSRELSYFGFSLSPNRNDSLSREVSFGPPVPFEPEIAVSSRELTFTAFQSSPVLNDSLSREVSFGPAPLFEPKIATVSREMTYAPLANHSALPKDVVSRELTTKVTTVLTGSIEFLDLHDPESAPDFVWISVKDPGNVELGPFRIRLEDGNYRIANLPRQVLRVSVKETHWLRQAKQVDLSTGLDSVDFNLSNGDCDDDNVVSIFDYVLISQSFDLFRGDPNFVPGADLDEDGTISIFDYIILSENFDRVGDDY